MHNALPAEDIAKALKLSRSQVMRKAKEGLWSYEEQTLRQGGKRRVFCTATLPEGIRDAIVAHQAKQGPRLPAPVPAPVAPASLPDWQRRCRDARAAVLLEVDRLQAVGGYKRPRPAILAVVQAAADGTLAPSIMIVIPQANARSGDGSGARTLSVETVYRWYGLRERGGLDALAPKPAKEKAPIPAWLALLLRLYQNPQKPSVLACLEDLPAHLPPGVAMPSASAARRWLDRMAPAERNKGRLGPRALLALKAFIRRDTSVLEPMDVVVADGHTHRARCAHPMTGRPMQPEVMAVMDAATRYVFGWSAGLSESTHTVMDGLRHGVSNLGLFAILYTDNGSGFVNDATSDELTGFYARLGCLHERATPGRAQARGLIERPNQSLWRRAAKRQVSYVGRDMDREAARTIDKLTMKDIKAAGRSDLLPTWEQLLADLGAVVDAYNNRPHRSLPKIRDKGTGTLRHMSPAECLQSWRDRGWQPMLLDEREMDDLFRPQERRKTLRGEVQLPWGNYFSHDLVAHHDQWVLVGYDTHDGSRVWVRDLEGRLICIAPRDGNVQPYQPASKVEHGRDKRAKGRTRILQDKLDMVEMERRADGRCLDLSPADTTPSADALAAADVEFVRLSAPAPELVPVEPAPGARPTFVDDTSWARWLIAHPNAVTPSDRMHLSEQLRRNPFRMLMAAEGVDLSALAALATPSKKAEMTDA